MGISRAAHRNTHSLDCLCGSELAQPFDARGRLFCCLCGSESLRQSAYRLQLFKLPIRQRTWNLGASYFLLPIRQRTGKPGRAGVGHFLSCLYGSELQLDRQRGRACCCLYGSEPDPGPEGRRFCCLYGSEPRSQTRSSLMISKLPIRQRTKITEFFTALKLLLPIRQRTSNFVTRPFSSISAAYTAANRRPAAALTLMILSCLYGSEQPRHRLRLPAKLPIRQRTRTIRRSADIQFLSCLYGSELRRPGARDVQHFAAYTAANGWPAGTKALQHFCRLYGSEP